MTYKTITFKREELYNEVWSEPMTNLARRYGISDVGLAKVCKSLKIPRPPRGYWASIRSGGKIRKPRLPEMEGNPVFESHVGYLGEEPLLVDDRIISRAQALIEAESLPEKRVVLPNSDEPRHPLIEKTRKSLAKPHHGRGGLLRPRKRKCLPLSLTPVQVERGLGIMQALLNAFADRGYKTGFGEEGMKFFVKVLDEAIYFRLIEKQRQIPKEEKGYQGKIYIRHDLEPTGRLTLQIMGQSSDPDAEWMDGKKRRVEEHLNDFMVGLLETSLKSKSDKRRHEIEEVERRESKERWMEEELRREKERERIRLLEQYANEWQHSNSLRAFVDAVRARAVEQSGTSPNGSALEEWLNWATAYCERLDPIPRLLSAEDLKAK